MKAIRTKYQRGRLAVALAEKIREDVEASYFATLADHIVYALSAPMPILQGRIAADPHLQKIMEGIPE
jgi:hypothetical protein